MALPQDQPLYYCSTYPRSLPQLRPDLSFDRQSAILVSASKWVNGTVLHYHFLADEADHGDQMDVVRAAFQEWKDLGIGLSFTEVTQASESEVRIGFQAGDGSWSYVGRDVLGIGATERTMNFGWDLTTPYGHTTARHEIGHTLGMPHEHQNPNAGITWDEEAVYEFLGGPPNNWPRETTFHNVLRKLDPRQVEGGTWDPDSIMEYQFPGGLILAPEAYRGGITPPGTLSADDQAYMRYWYPPLDGDDLPELVPFQSAPLSLTPGQQADFAFHPDASREYSVGTFGSADSVLVVFEEVDGELRFLAGDDDSGEDRNALVKVKLVAGRSYVVRTRLYYAWASGQTAVMAW
ncbi:hypothetical protein E8D34_07860 [Nocardioides sp. GY 10113]|uniref:M12 family metallopeptidase n=1 Tax=Nocardioides sp. GY 10113 TaxID=2569761 RepID=UPI0010A91380|nr:M12 family metallopeptidase [Nocardioides sp. GY 10113]TIC87599.1 hypothetical protein E8D34_07860 [Nocardioides sp. GY 10113]